MKLAARAVAAVLVALLVAPMASAIQIDLTESTILGDVVAPPGESIIIRSSTDLFLTGLISTSASDEAGADGPSIVIDVRGMLVISPSALVHAGDGRPGAQVAQTGAAIAGDGGAGGDVLITSRLLHAEGATIQSGNGGPGGNAISLGNPDAFARGGDGGRAGFIALLDAVIGAPRLLPGNGGAGGTADATGAEGCTGRDGDPERAEGFPVSAGDAPTQNATATDGSCGDIAQDGGRGGDAEAIGGHGGPAPQAEGGKGGDAIALAGKGGRGGDACFATYEEGVASGLAAAGNGGDGGRARAIGGDGAPGFVGGSGGSAVSQTIGGAGGNSSPPMLWGRGGVNGALSEARGGVGGVGVNGGGGGASSLIMAAGGAGYDCAEVNDQFPGRSRSIPEPSGLTVVALMTIFARRWRQARLDAG